LDAHEFPLTTSISISIFIGKAISDVKSKIINHDLERVIRKANVPFAVDTVIFAMNVKLMKVIIAPTLHDLDYVVKHSQLRISSDS